MLQRFAIVLSAAGMVATLACAQSDPGITTSVKSQLAADAMVKAYQIDVDTQGRIVTLTGTVDNAEAKEQAASIARQTDGVLDVVDRITVSPQPTATSGDLRDDARETGREIREQAQEAAEATKAGARTAGEKVGEAADRTGALVTDAAITSAVKSRFLADTAVSGLKIDVDTKAGVVTLNGTVASRAEAQRAVSVARDTSGVKRVVDNLRVQG